MTAALVTARTDHRRARLQGVRRRHEAGLYRAEDLDLALRQRVPHERVLHSVEEPLCPVLVPEELLMLPGDRVSVGLAAQELRFLDPQYQERRHRRRGQPHDLLVSRFR